MASDETSTTTFVSALRVGQLLLATLVVDALAFAIDHPRSQTESILVGLVFGQVGVACVWVVFGRASRYLRSTVLAAVIVLWSIALSINYGPGILDMFSIIGAFAIITLITLFVLQMSWVATRYRPSFSGKRQGQFRFRDMFVLMAFVAIVATAVRYADDIFDSDVFVAFADCLCVCVALAFVAQAIAIRWLAIAMGLILTTIIGAIFSLFPAPGSTEVVSLAQAATMIPWLWFGGVIPLRNGDLAPTSTRS